MKYNILLRKYFDAVALTEWIWKSDEQIHKMLMKNVMNIMPLIISPKCSINLERRNNILFSIHTTNAKWIPDYMVMPFDINSEK